MTQLSTGALASKEAGAKVSSGVIRMSHSVDGAEQADRIFNMRLQADRESFVRFASWASRNSITFTCTAL